MSREVRRVPAGWEHPRTDDGSYVPLHLGSQYAPQLREWRSERDLWGHGIVMVGPDEQLRDIAAADCSSFEDWAGAEPVARDYMPDWAADECTHWQMYETTTAGTPLSPPLQTPEELASWLAEHEASACGLMLASREQWLAMILVGYAPGLVVVPRDGKHELVSGVAFISRGQ